MQRAFAGGAEPSVTQEDARSGSLRDRLAPADDADLVLLFGGEQGGELGPCGCEARPLGSLARVEGYRRALVRGDAPAVLLNSGGFLDAAVGADGALRPDVEIADAAMIAGLEAGDWAVWNVGAPDLPHLAAHGFPEAAVSANLRPSGGEGPGPAPWRLVEAGPWKVAVTGTSAEATAGWVAGDPVEAVASLLPAMRAEADLVVVLAWQPGAAARDLARLDVDVLVEAGGFEARWAPTVEGGTVWVRSDHQTRQLGELRLHLEEGVVRALDRRVDLDDRIPSDRRSRRLATSTAREVEVLRRQVFSAP